MEIYQKKKGGGEWCKKWRNNKVNIDSILIQKRQEMQKIHPKVFCHYDYCLNLKDALFC